MRGRKMPTVKEYILLALLVEEQLLSREIIEIVKKMGEDDGKNITTAQIYARLYELRKDGYISRSAGVYKLTETGKEAARNIVETIKGE